MRKLLFILFCFNLLSAFGQFGDCATTVDACSNPSFMVTPSGSGNIEDFTVNSTVSNPQTNPNAVPGNAGCLLSGELNSTWLLITVSSPGTLEFSMGTAGAFNCNDWIMWPYDANTCGNIQNNTLPPVACNWNGACTGITGMANPGNLPAGADQSDFENGINVNAGDQYIICFSNYSSANTNVPLDFYGTAGVTCGSVTNPTICEGETAMIVALDGVSYNWDTSIPGFINTNAAGDTAYVNPTVTTIYDVNITLGNGTIQSEISVVTVHPAIIPSVVTTTETCIGDNNGSLVFSATNGVAPITYTLSGASTGSNTNGTFNNLPSGNYTIDIEDDNGCSAQLSVTLNPGPLCCGMTLSTSTVNNDCFGDCDGTATLDTTGTTGPAPIQWFDGNGNPIAGATTLNINNLCAGNYSVQVTDPACTLTENITITAPNQITLSFVTTTETCIGQNDGALVFTAQNTVAPVTFNLSGASTSSNTNGTFNNLPSGNYTLDIVDGNGCIAQINATLNPGPVCCNMTLSTTQTNNLCFGECSGVATVDTVGTSGPAPIQWFNNGAPIPGATSATVNNLCAGTYTVQVSDPSCTLSQTVTITEPTAFNITIDETNLSCFQNNSGIITINANGGALPYQYSIDNGIQYNVSNVFSNLSAATYNILVMDNNNCSQNATVTLTQPNELIANFNTIDNSCNQNNTPCNGGINLNILGGVEPYSYSWNNSLPPFQNQVNLCAGFYDVSITDGNNCAVTLSNIEVTEPGELTINNIVQTNPLCISDCNGSISIDASNAVNYSINNGNTFQNNPIFTDLCSGNYQIVVTDANSCEVTSNVSLINPEAVIASFNFGPQPATTQNPEIFFENTSLNDDNVFWFTVINEDTNYFYQSDPTIRFPEDGPNNYNVCIVASNANNCIDTACNIVIIDDVFFVFVPNAFTPNNDGDNDVFFPVINHFLEDSFEFLIFNRWGTLVFESESPYTGWDGNHLSTPVQEGVYIWKLNAKNKTDGLINTFTGHVTLLR